MKLLPVLSLVLWATLVFGDPVPQSSDDIKTWEEFKHFFNKSYSSPAEEATRKANFENTLKFVQENKQQDGFELGLNEWSDLTHDELFPQVIDLSPEELNETLALQNQTVPIEIVHFSNSLHQTLPEKFDYMRYYQSLPVADQRNCGACYAFGPVATVEGMYSLKKGKHIQLSQQQLIDCTQRDNSKKKYLNSGCKGGRMLHSYKYIRDEGLYEAAHYPFVEQLQPSCNLTSLAGNVTYKIKSFWPLQPKSSDELKQYLKTHGPLTTEIMSTNLVKQYKKGIIREHVEHPKTNHGVVLLGWGKEKVGKEDVEYWIIRNSHGPTWGERGYGKVEIGRLGLGQIAFYVELP